MKSLNFAFRNYREIIRDPLSVIFQTMPFLLKISRLES